MSDILSWLADFDRSCAQLSTALHNAQPQLYAMIALVVLFTALLFRKDDPDQI